jgi:hypothetical protein
MVIVMDRKYQEFCLLELLKGGCRLRQACDLTGLTPAQGDYVLEKRKTTARDTRRYYRLKTVTKDAVRVAVELLSLGATGEEVAMITGLTVDQVMQLSDPEADYWFE